MEIIMKKEKLKVATIKGEVLRKIVDLRGALLDLIETRQDREKLSYEFTEIIIKLIFIYRKVVNPSIIAREKDKWIKARYWNVWNDEEYITLLIYLNTKYPLGRN
jgi:hypothetical protein